MPDLSDEIPIPPKAAIKQGLSSARVKTMLSVFREPGRTTADCSDTTGTFAQRVIHKNVGPYTDRGLDFAVESLRQIFEGAKSSRGDIYDAVENGGMLCVRHRRGNPNRFSNHSWAYLWISLLFVVLCPASFGQNEILMKLHSQKLDASAFPGNHQLEGMLLWHHQHIPVLVCHEFSAADAALLDSRVPAKDYTTYGPILDYLKDKGFGIVNSDDVCLIQSPSVKQMKVIPLDTECPKIGFKGTLEELSFKLPLAKARLGFAGELGRDDKEYVLESDNPRSLREALLLFAKQNKMLWSAYYYSDSNGVAQLASGHISFYPNTPTK